jgi:hypothetical protein
MKRVLVFLLLVMSFSLLKANPIYIPMIYLNQFSFVDDYNWNMVFSNRDVPDSIMISSSASRSIFKPEKNSRDFITITNDSLSPDFSINCEGDSITFIYYSDYNFNDGSNIEIVKFGNFPGATVPRPSTNQYIGRVGERIMGSSYHAVFDSDGNPTGTISGKVYDKNNKLLSDGHFSIDPIPVSIFCLEGSFEKIGFDVKSDGTFSTYAHSLLYNLDSIVSCTKHSQAGCEFYEEKESLAVDKVNFTLYPDSSVEMDIHLLDDYVGINTMKAATPDMLKLFPNPLFDNCLRYEVTSPVKSTHCCLHMVDLTGRTVQTFPITENRGTITLPASVPDGIYLMQLWLNNKSCQTKQFTIKRQ